MRITESERFTLPNMGEYGTEMQLIIIMLMDHWRE